MPPFVAFSIGSFGDILAVLQLLYRLRDALNELTGAAAEMRVLIDDIDRMTRALIQVKAALERRGSQIQPDVANGIRVAVATCEDILCAALGAIEGFKRRITNATGAAGWRAYCAVLGWSVLGGKQRVDALRTRLSEQLSVIELYFALSQSCGQANIQESLRSQGATLLRLCEVVQDMQLRFDVGVPSFMFLDQTTGKYCIPLARTSLERLRDVYERHLGDRCNDLRCSPDEEGNTVRRLPLKFNSFSHFYDEDDTRPWGAWTEYRPSIECFIFQERAFGQWQALVSIPFDATGVADYAAVIKLLLERNHGPKTQCNCHRESCLSKRQFFHERRESFRQMLDEYTAASRLVAKGLLVETRSRPCLGYPPVDKAIKPYRWPGQLYIPAFDSAGNNLSPQWPPLSDFPRLLPLSGRVFQDGLRDAVRKSNICPQLTITRPSAPVRWGRGRSSTTTFDLLQMTRIEVYPFVMAIGSYTTRFLDPVGRFLDML